MVFDIEKYLPYLDQYDGSREEKIEILRTLWQMMETQVDKAFGLGAVQLSGAQNKDKPSQKLSDALDSKVNVATASFGEAINKNHPITTGDQDATQ